MGDSQHDVARPGRLGDASRSPGTDPRADLRLQAALAAVGFDATTPPSPFTVESAYDDLVAFSNEAEPGFQGLFGMLGADLEPIKGVAHETVTIDGRDGNEVTLYVHRPVDASGPVPGILHLHGGGMTLLTAADPAYARWRDELAAAGLVVVGVEFRNAGGVLGPHPFPAGLNDCSSGLAWMHAHRDELGISKIVVSGESGGGNLTIATTLAARRDGVLDCIDGVYAMCPYISGLYASQPPELASLTENDGYFLGCDMMGGLAKLYTPTDETATDPLAWPYHATVDQLTGLPPHVISVNELDPLRDEGLTYARRLAAAGVSVVSRTVNGTTHAGDMIFEAALPDVHRATVRDIVGFANSL